MNIIIGSARIDERGKLTGGQPGNEDLAWWAGGVVPRGGDAGAVSVP